MTQLQSFQNSYVSLTTTLTHRLQSILAAARFQRMQQRRHQLGAGRPERVPEGDRATVHIGFSVIKTRVFQPGHCNGRKGFVNLYTVLVLPPILIHFISYF